MSLIDSLVKEKILQTPEIISAFKMIRRADFLPPDLAASAELDEALPIGYGQTNSQPYTVAFMLEKLQPKPGDRILDVGCGSGWTTALAAEIVGEQGSVYGVEIVPELMKLAEANVAKYGFIKSARVKIYLGDGRYGLPALAPFDKIIVSAATAVLPAPLGEQLKYGGRMILPIGRENSAQSLVLVEKTASGRLQQTAFPGFVFVPLIKTKD